MKKEELKNLQAELDVLKWNDSQDKGADACGSYDYCVKCDKGVEYPCATAKAAAEKPKKAPAKKSAKAAAKKSTEKKAVAVAVVETSSVEAVAVSEKPVAKKACARKPRAKKAE